MKKDWQIKKLGEVCEFQGGSQPPKEEWIKEPREGYIRMLQIRDFTQSRNFDIEYVKETNKLRLCNSDDILLGRYGASVGKVLTGLSGAYNVAILRTIPSSDYYKPFIKYYFQSPFFQNPLLTLCNQRAAQAGFNREDIYDFSIPYLTLEEQKRIVAVLDKKFAQIETLKTAAEKNLQNTKQLFQAELEKAFSNTSWEKKRLGDYCEVTDGDHMPPPKSKTGYPFITISNIDKDLYKINFEETFFVPEDYFLNLKDNRKPKKGDVLYTVTGSYGIPVLINGEKEFCFQRHIGLLRPNSSLSSEYLFYWILTPKAKSLADEVATGTAQRTVSLGSLRTFEIPIPSLEEQKRIVAHLDSLSEKVHQLEEIYTKQLTDCDELKQSLLQKAFEGEL